MKTKTLSEDLFPETLLVDIEGNHIYTTSLKVAQYFEKRHKHILPIIKTAIEQAPDEVSRTNFRPRNYVDARGKEQPIYELTHDGFMFIVQGFTGLKAAAWKWKFIAAFREMERQLLSKTQREADVLYNLKPRWKPVVNNPSLSRLQLIAMTGHKSAGSITACRKSMKKNGLID